MKSFTSPAWFIITIEVIIKINEINKFEYSVITTTIFCDVFRNIIKQKTKNSKFTKKLYTVRIIIVQRLDTLEIEPKSNIRMFVP